MANYNNFNQNPNQQQNQQPNQQPNQAPYYNQYQQPLGIDPPPGYIQKSRVAAGLLAILLGVYGIHSFYLGNSSKGVMQLLISVLTCGVGAIAIAIWGIVEGIKILDGRINIDANGVFLKD